jgi:hypothetical protein
MFPIYRRHGQGILLQPIPGEVPFDWRRDTLAVKRAIDIASMRMGWKESEGS